MYFCKMLKSQLRKQKLIKHNINMKKTILMATILGINCIIFAVPKQKKL